MPFLIGLAFLVAEVGEFIQTLYVKCTIAYKASKKGTAEYARLLPSDFLSSRTIFLFCVAYFKERLVN